MSRVTAVELVLSSKHRQALVEVSGLMAQAQGAVPQWLFGNQGGCFAIAMQAVAWNMSPFAVAQKSHLIRNNIGYEAQLVNAVVCSSGAISGRFKYEYVGDWQHKIGEGCRVGAIIAGEEDVTWGHTHYLSDVKVKNSELWKTNPQQQLSYLVVKAWARLFAPDALMGVYSTDELVAFESESESSDTEIVNTETSNVTTAKKALNECTDKSYLEKLATWIGGFSDSEQVELKPFLDEKAKEFIVIDDVDF